MKFTPLASSSKGNAYLVEAEGRVIAEYANGKRASDATGICHRNIMQVANKTEYKPGLVRKQAGGYGWRVACEI